MEGKSKTGLKILISVTPESYKLINFLIAEDLSISFYNIVVPDAFHTQCCLRFDDPVVIYLSFYDHTASKNLVKIHHLFFLQEKQMALYSPSHHDAVKVHHKNTVFH